MFREARCRRDRRGLIFGNFRSSHNANIVYIAIADRVLEVDRADDREAGHRLRDVRLAVRLA